MQKDRSQVFDSGQLRTAQVGQPRMAIRRLIRFRLTMTLSKASRSQRIRLPQVEFSTLISSSRRKSLRSSGFVHDDELHLPIDVL